MTRPSSFRTFAPIWVGVSALAVIVWELAAQSSAMRVPAVTSSHADVIRLSMTRPVAQSDSAVSFVAPDLPQPEPSWQLHYVALELQIDPDVAIRGGGAFESLENRPEESFWREDIPARYLSAHLRDSGRLDVVHGTSRGGDVQQAELRFLSDANGRVFGGVVVRANPSGNQVWGSFWTNVKGRATLSANRWKSGDVLLIDYQIDGFVGARIQTAHGRLRVVVP